MTNPVEVTGQRPIPTPLFSESEITLYGVPLNSASTYFGFNSLSFSIFIQAFATNPSGPLNLGAALIYGYAYQGHCYSLPEPVIMIVDRTPGKEAPAAGCGFAAPYLMWSVDQKYLTAEVKVTNDTFENLILNKNLPGPKQPSAYMSKIAAVAHRGGRLIE